MLLLSLFFVVEMRLLQIEVTHKKTRLHISVETGLSCSLISVVRDRGQATERLGDAERDRRRHRLRRQRAPVPRRP